MKKIITTFIVIAAFYALVPFLGAVYFWLYSTTGDPGSMFLFHFPLFWPAYITFMISFLISSPLKFLNIGDLNSQTIFLQTVAGVVNIALWGLIGFIVGKIASRSNIRSKNRTLTVFFIACLVVIAVLSPVSATEWIGGDLHEHTGYSTQLGINWALADDDCNPPLLEGHLAGYGVQELAEDAIDSGLDYLAFSDHSYCIDENEFNDIRDDCLDVDDNEDDYPGFTCIMGEELSTQDKIGDNEDLLLYCENPSTGEAHVGAYGISSMIGQTPIASHCPTTPTAQSGINSVNSHGGFAVLNHPKPDGGFLDFESMPDVTGATGLEIWNEGWSSDDQDTRNAWVDLLQEGQRLYAYGGSDDHEGVTDVNYNIARVDSQTPNDLEEGLSGGTNVVSNNGYVILEAKKNTQTTWTQMGGELTASQNEILNIRLQYNLENSCTLKIYSSRVGSSDYLENVYTLGTVSGVGQAAVDYPLVVSDEFYYRAECAGGESRTYTNPIWVDVGTGGSCTAWQGNSCGINSCASDEVYQTRTCGGVVEDRCQFSNQCSASGVQSCNAPACPSGYGSQGVSCGWDGIYWTCDRTCFRAGSCGTYGGFTLSGSSSRNVDENDDGIIFTSPGRTTSTSTCYRFRGESELFIDDWDPGGVTHFDAESVRVYAQVTNQNSYSQCSGGQSSPVSRQTADYTLGRGTGSTYRDAGWFTPYQGPSCSSGVAYGIEGELFTDLYYSTASWTSEDTDHTYCDVPTTTDISLAGPLYANVNAQCSVEVDGIESDPVRIEVKWYVDGDYVENDDCDDSGGDACDDHSGGGWDNIFELDHSYYGPGDEVYCIGRAYGEHQGHGAYDQSDTEEVVNRIPTWASVTLNQDYSRQGNSILATANGEDDLDTDTLSMYCCNGAGCTPSTSNFDFCFASGDSSPYDLQCIGEGASGDGTKTVQCRLHDGISYSTSLSDTYIADNTGPNISATGVNISSAYINEYARLNCTSTDAGIGISGRWIEADRPTSVNQNYSLSLLSGNTYYTDIQLIENGTWRFNCWANDSLGNINNKTMSTINVIQSTPPQIMFVAATPSNGTSIISSSILVNVSVNDDDMHYSFIDFDRDVSLWFTMDDVNGTNITDLSTYSNNGTAHNGSAQDTSGKFGKSFSFDGVNDYVSVTDNSAFTTTDLTFSAWVRDRGTGVELIAEQLSGVGGATRGWYIDADGTFHMFGLWSGGGQDDDSNVSIRDGQWHHIVVVRDSSASVRRFYVDGVSRANFSDTQTGQADPNQTLFIGSRSGTQYFLNGSIDEIILINRALSQSEVSSLYDMSASHYSHTFSDLALTDHRFRAHAVDVTANRNKTEERVVTLYNPAPSIAFVTPTPQNNSIVNKSTVSINISSSDDSTHYALLDVDRSNVLWLRMDDVNASGDPSDISTYGNNATKLNGSSQTSSGKFGSAFNFDGVNDLLSIPDSASFTANALTMTAWIKSQGTGIQVIMEQLRQNSTGKTRGLYVANDGTLHFFGAWEGDGQDDGANYTVRDGTWHHVAVTRNDLDNLRIFYVDGIERARFNDTQTGINDPDLPFYIGSRSGSQFFFNGSIDEVIVSNRAFAATEIAALYNASANQYITTFDDSSEGSHSIRGFAVDSSALRNSTEERTFTVALSLNITDLEIVYQNATERVFRFIVNNTRASSTSNVAWNISTGQSSIVSQQNMTLQGGESALVYVYYNYTTPGNYTVKAHTYTSLYSDKRSIQIRV